MYVHVYVRGKRKNNSCCMYKHMCLKLVLIPLFHYYITLKISCQLLRLKMNLEEESNEECKPSTSNLDLENFVFKRPLNACPRPSKKKQRQRVASKSSESVIKIAYEENLSMPAPKQPINVFLEPKKEPKKEKQRKQVATKSGEPLPKFLYEENPDDFAEQKTRYLEANVENPNSYSDEELKRLRRRVRNRMSAKKARLEQKKRIKKLKKEREILKAKLVKSSGELQAKIEERYGNSGIYKQKLAKLQYLKALSQYYKSAKFFTIPPYCAFKKLKRCRKQKK